MDTYDSWIWPERNLGSSTSQPCGGDSGGLPGWQEGNDTFPQESMRVPLKDSAPANKTINIFPYS